MGSPLQMARAECANLVGDVCLGIPWQCLDGSRKIVGRERDGCLLSKPKVRCEYFERVIVPPAEYWPKKYAPAVRAYRRRIPKGQDPPAALVNAWTCDCGELMPKGRRMCDSCARKNRRETYRRARAKQQESSATVSSCKSL